MTDDSAVATDGENATDDREEQLRDVVEGVLSDIDAAHEDYERGYTDADATLSVVMTHVERLREAHDAE
jgi:hypothetical protein